MRALFLFRSGRRCVVARVIAEILDELKAALVEWRLVLSASEQAQLRALEDVETCLEVETVAHALTTCALATVDQLEATRLLSGRTSKSWLIEDLYLSKPEAGRRMKFLRFLHGFPLVTAASHAGELSVERVSAVLSAVLSLPPAARDAVEGPLVEQARPQPHLDQHHRHQTDPTSPGGMTPHRRREFATIAIRAFRVCA